MKLSTRLISIVATSILGLLLIGGFALHDIRSTMMAERETQIRTLLDMSKSLLGYFNGLEQAGKLTRGEAQIRAIEALSHLNQGNNYVYARTDDDTMIVHIDPTRVGKVDHGARMPNGKTVTEAYRDALAIADPALITITSTKPGIDKSIVFPKLNGVSHFAPWSWTLGTGFFVDDIDSAFTRYALTLLLVGAVIIALTSTLAVVLTRRIYAQLGGEPEAALSSANAIAAGDLTHPLPVATEGSLVHALGIMQTNLKSMISGIQRGSSSLNEAATSIASTMQEIRHASGQSSEATASTAAAIEEMTVSVGQIADSAHETEHNSSRSVTLAQGGEKLVMAASDAILAVSTQVDEASNRIAELAERSRQIGGIAGTIKEIAEQTNLLALNAAIEAARAGEQGRGFAVVADEVRKLAERTTRATQEIAETIAAIRTDTDLAVGSMQAVPPQVQKGVSLAGEAAGALRSIREGADETLIKIRDVAHATSEQRSASNAIATNIERIARMVEESDTAVHHADETARVLSGLAGELNATVAKFRV